MNKKDTKKPKKKSKKGINVFILAIIPQDYLNLNSKQIKK